MPIGFVLNTIDLWMDWHRGEICQVSFLSLTFHSDCVVNYGLTGTDYKNVFLMMKYRMLGLQTHPCLMTS
jgi:hypothetical protein